MESEWFKGDPDKVSRFWMKFLTKVGFEKLKVNPLVLGKKVKSPGILRNLLGKT